jgi:hypothetical protein
MDRRLTMGDAMMLGRGRCGQRTAKNNCSGKRNFYLARHFQVSWALSSLADR